MEERKVTIKDIAEDLGLSTATVSNVIHGKTKKISDRTVEKVQEALENSGYIPNMAAVLLAQNSSRIVCVMLSDDVKYHGHMMEDPFVAGILNGLSKELSSRGYFMMVKEEKELKNIIRYASMWNMAGLILIGYCMCDYVNLRNNLHIPFVVVDSYQKEAHNYSDVGTDNMEGGRLAGRYLLSCGHHRIMYLADNKEDCDYDRYLGLREVLEEHNLLHLEEDYKIVSMNESERKKQYSQIVKEIMAHTYSAAFCASDVYAIEFMNFLNEEGLRVPEDISIIGFDNIPLSASIRPALTTISQNLSLRALKAVELLEELIHQKGEPRTEILPVTLITRNSVASIYVNEKVSDGITPVSDHSLDKS